MTDKVLDFLDALCEKADAERKAGQAPVTMGVIYSNPALQYYFENVYKLGTPAKSFTFTGMYSMAVAFVEAYQADEARNASVDEHSDRISALEAQLIQAQNMIKQLVEGQGAADDTEPENAPKRKRKAKATEPVSPAAETDAEGDDDDSAESDDS